MKIAETLPMFSPEELPQTDEPTVKKKEKQFKNILYLQLNRLMNHFGYSAQDLHLMTGMAHPTLSDWINGKVENQLLDDDVFKISKVFGVTINYLGYGTPETDRDLELENEMEDLDEKKEVNKKEHWGLYDE